ncbi:hypothetical protein BLA29_013964, partial [Euroglyphus maynei]
MKKLTKRNGYTEEEEEEEED